MYFPVMATHSDILKRAGVAEVHRRLTARGLTLAAVTVQKWADRNSIPNPYWLHIEDLGLATLSELAEASAAQPVNDGRVVLLESQNGAAGAAHA